MIITWSDVINIILKVFGISSKTIAKLMNTDPSTISRLKTKRSKRPTFCGLEEWYKWVFDPKNHPGKCENGTMLLSILKEVIKEMGFESAMNDMWAETDGENYRRFVMTLLNRTRDNNPPYEKPKNRKTSQAYDDDYESEYIVHNIDKYVPDSEIELNDVDQDDVDQDDTHPDAEDHVITMEELMFRGKRLLDDSVCEVCEIFVRFYNEYHIEAYITGDSEYRYAMKGNADTFIKVLEMYLEEGAFNKIIENKRERYLNTIFGLMLDEIDPELSPVERNYFKDKLTYDYNYEMEARDEIFKFIKMLKNYRDPRDSPFYAFASGRELAYSEYFIDDIVEVLKEIRDFRSGEKNNV